MVWAKRLVCFTYRTFLAIVPEACHLKSKFISHFVAYSGLCHQLFCLLIMCTDQRLCAGYSTRCQTSPSTIPGDLSQKSASLSAVTTTYICGSSDKRSFILFKAVGNAAQFSCAYLLISFFYVVRKSSVFSKLPQKKKAELTNLLSRVVHCLEPNLDVTWTSRMYWTSWLTWALPSVLLLPNWSWKK